MYRFLYVVILLIFTLPSLAETITLVAEDDWAPYSSIKADKSGPQGLAPALITQAFKLKNVEVNYITLPFARCMYYALIGKNIGCFDATITQENKDQYYWHATPLFTEGVSVFAPRNAKLSDVNIKDMEGKTVGYTIGYTYSPEIFTNKKIKIFGTNSDHQQLTMVAAGRIDYALVNTTPGIATIKKYPHLTGKVKIVGHLSNDNFYIAFSKKHPDGKRLMEIFESGLSLLKSNGQYDKMMHDFKQEYSLQSVIKH